AFPERAMYASRLIRPFVAAAAAAGLLAGCASVPASGGGNAGPAAFRAEDFAWSAGSGSAAIEGRIDYRRDGQAFACTGSVAATPDTPYTRARFRTLYGSTERAAVPEAVVRARTVPDPNADSRAYARAGWCQGNAFA